MSTTLTKLIEKARNNKDGIATLNGRMNHGWGVVGDLEEKYAIVIEKDTNIVRLRHWGTETLAVDIRTDETINWYGESNSDRDSMNFILNYFGVADEVGRFGYRPSIDLFELRK